MMIEATGVRRSYGAAAQHFEAVRGVDLSVSSGELVAVLGVNGAGKTSFIELLEGMARPSAGTIRVFGRDPIKERKTIRPRTGIMLQEAGFSGELSVTETLRMWARTLSDPRPFGEAIELAGLHGREAVRVKSLSGGERRRLDLAMATLGQPQLLFMDEPTTGLDPESRHRTWDVVTHMLETGVTVVMTTHYLEEAERLADRVVVMAAGRITREGTVGELTRDLPSVVSFGAEVVDALPHLDRLPGVCSLEVREDKVIIATTDLQASLKVLLDRAGEIRLPGLSVEAPTLEQAFLTITH